LIWVLALAAVGLCLDFRRFRAVHLPLSLAPFLAGAAGWGLYILRAPSVFAAQFSANAGYRAAALASPFATLAAEITQRYLQYYFWSAHVFALARLKILILLAYFGALLLVMMTPAARRLRGAKMLILIALVALVALGVLDNKKLPGYFVHVLPPLASMVAVAAWWLWSATRVPKPLIALGVTGFMALQLVGLANRVVRNPYQNVYLPVVRFVAANATSSTLVSGPAQLFYGLPPEIRVVDDLTLGYRSGVEPDLIVGDEFYAEPLPGKVQRRPWQRHVQKLLNEKFRLAFSRGAWRVYLRR